MHLSLHPSIPLSSGNIPALSGPARRTPSRPHRTLLAALLVASFSLIGTGQARSESYEPTVGQAGKDVVWVPTPQALVEKMLDIANVTPQDYLIDLGSGDGRTVITAARRGLRAHGIEYNPEMADLARKNAQQAGVAGRATFATADLFETNLSDAQVITMFLLPTINEKLRPRILDLKPGTRIVSNSFTMGDWQADRSATVNEGCEYYCTALLWIVPAKAAGTWQMGDQELSLTQNFQVLSGKLGSADISDARLNGNQISFTVNGARYIGTINGTTMSGKVTGGPSASWSAKRA